MDCVGRAESCGPCCANSHRLNPLHRIEYWTGTHYEQSWLRTLGVRVALGHSGADCPTQRRWERSSSAASRSVKTSSSPLMMVVVDVSGVHELPFVFCSCADAESRDLQLLRMGYYPATARRPRTVFTFRVLDDFLLTNKECKTAAMNYYNKLRRITDDTFPHAVPDRYRDLLRVSRQWRNLKARKRFGVGYRNEQPPGPGGLTTSCPACPRPGINMADGWEQDADRWKHMPTVILDGNFSAQHQHMKNPQDDVRLSDGHGYMVTSAPYREHLRTAVQFKQKLTCHDHRAVLAAASERAPLEATGIGAAACSRHGFFIPHSTVDFQKGEQQKNMDYCLCQVILFFQTLYLLLILYDIWCHYCVHLMRRFERSPSLHMPADLTVMGGIDQFHVHGHIRECYPRYSPNFIPGAGVQDGDVLETLWINVNEISTSTRGMSDGHRQESIDDIMEDSNWNKLLRVAPALARKWRTACEEWGPAAQALQKAGEEVDPKQIEQWTRLAKRAAEMRHKDIKVMDVFEFESRKLPTRAEIQLQLTRAENEHREGLKGSAAWLASGLKIEETRLSVAAKARSVTLHSPLAEQIALEQMRTNLLRDIERFHKEAASYLSPLTLAAARSLDADISSLGMEWDSITAASEVADERATPAQDGEADTHEGSNNRGPTIPERMKIALPSNLGRAFCKEHGLEVLVKKERELRVGVRKATSHRQKLRSFDEVHLADAGVLHNARTYSAARAASAALYDERDPKELAARDELFLRYRVLEKTDLKANTAIIEQATRGIRNKHLAWFWSLDVEEDSKESPWMSESA
ncbi:hypothetical protein C8Q76DRAFT_770330 [Earliella scabrosa]|nr:hypothetical protein C8Q76DRAFT_770330 [Earliella scabrosa]